jgi:hypothetical protein
MCEMRLLKNEPAPFAPLYAYLEKYPKHRSFRKEIATAIKEAGLPVTI